MNMVRTNMNRNFDRILLALFLLQALPCLTFGDDSFSSATWDEGMKYSSRFSDPNELAENAMHKFRQLEDRVLSGENNHFGYRAAVQSFGPTPTPSVCELRTKKSIFVYGKCPDVCLPHLKARFIECGSLIQFGCTMVACEGGYRCTLRNDLTKGTVVCPGDKIIFEDVELNSFQNVSYKIDLRAPPVQTDLYFLSDVTGSMRRAIKVAKTKFQDLVRVFGQRENVAIGVGYYRDETELSGGFRNALPITENTDLVRDAVNTLTATGGGDGDEANLVALYKVATSPSIGWRSNSRKILVHFGDYPGHEPTCVGNMRLTRAEVSNALKAKNITVVAVSFSPGLDRAPARFSGGSCNSAGSAGSGQSTFISSFTMGNLVESGSQARLVAAIEHGIGKLSSTFDVDESECEEKIDSVHTPSLPLVLQSDENTTVTNRIVLKDTLCAVVGKFQCRYRYTESGADLKTNEIEIVKIRGCPGN